MRLAIQTAGIWYLLALVGFACGGSQEPDAIDLARADEGGVDGTVRVDGDDVHVVSEDGPSTDPDRPGDQRTITVTAADGTVLASWTIDLESMEIIGEFDGHPFGLDHERDMDVTYWGGVVISPAADMLDRVSRAAEAAIAANPQAADHLRSISQLGPYLRKMAAPRGGTIEDCGDGVCDVDEDDVSCPEDCGCTANSCGGVAPMGCFCDATCVERGDCCADACPACGGEISGCPACDGYQCTDGTCIAAEGECDGEVQCTVSEDDEDLCGYSNCADDQLACDDGQCLPLTASCNGVEECGNGDDEQGCASSLQGDGRAQPEGAAIAETTHTRGETLAAIAVPDDTECHYRVKLKSGRKALSSCYWRWYIQGCMRDIKCGDRRPHLAIYRIQYDGSAYKTKLESANGAPHGGFLCDSVSKKWRKLTNASNVELGIKTWMDYDPAVWSKKKIDSPGSDVCIF